MNSTELINHMLDQQYAYDMKLYLLILFTCYSLYALWFFSKYEPKMLWQWHFQQITEVLCKAWMFAGLPLWILFLGREVPLDVIIRPMMAVYLVAGVLFGVFVFLYGGEKIKEFFTGEGFYRKRK